MDEKRLQAAALAYKPESDNAPRLVASGKGPLAERIMALAREHGVPIQKNPALVEVLLQLDLGREIPPELYQVVAEVLAFVYRLERADGL